MSQTITFGSVPAFESCAQVGQDDYETLALAECRRYAAGLETYYRSVRKLPMPFKAVVVVRTHDFGKYLEVAAVCESDVQVEAATWLQDHLPEMWCDLV
jgi:hypothetical protein